MKVGIVTFHRAVNYGASLQAFALYKTIEKLGKEPQIINYISPEILARHHKLALSFNPIKLYRYIRYGRTVNQRYAKFETFIKSLSLSPRVHSISDVGKEFDAIISGSDQVWNLKITNNNYNYLLKDIDSSIHRIAYAASFGISNYPANQESDLRAALDKFDAISVRETVGQEIVESLIGKRPELVLDPTLLLQKSEWQEFSEPFSIPGKYLLIYSVGEIEALFDLAREISKKYGYRIAVVSHRKFRHLPGAIYLKDLSPLEFVGVVDNAECVVTNSFHGTAFSVELEKRFIVVSRSEKDNPGLNSRMETLLASTGLTNQIYGLETTDIDLLLQTDHSQARERLATLREKSIKFLERSLAV